VTRGRGGHGKGWWKKQRQHAGAEDGGPCGGHGVAAAHQAEREREEREREERGERREEREREIERESESESERERERGSARKGGAER
jgi:hypothetical protein